MQRKPFPLDRALFILFAIDILFVPLFLPIPMPLSFAILPIWFLSLRRAPPPKVLIWAFIGIVFAMFSYLYGYNDSIAVDSLATQRIAYTAILILMFSAYAMGMATRFDGFSTVFALLRIYLIFVFLMAILFFVNFEAYFAIRGFWSFGHNVDLATELNSMTRFTGTMSDPNNLAVSTCAIAAILIFYEPSRIARNIAAVAMTCVIVTASMSVTGVICLSILVTAFVFGSRLGPTAKILLIVSTAIVGAGVFFTIHGTEVFYLATERVQDSSADTRFSRWQMAMDAHKFIHSLFIGDGGTIVLHGEDYRPHSGFIHLLYSFGMPCFFAFLATFFRLRNIADWRHYLFLVLLLIIFTVNVGIYEHRFGGIWVILLIVYHRSRLSVGRPSTSRMNPARHSPLQGPQENYSY